MMGIALAFVGCAASYASSRAEGPPSPERAISRRFEGEPPGGAPAVNPSLPTGTLRLDRYYTLSGGCADEAQSFALEHILFTDGRIMAIGDDGSLSAVERRPSVVGPSALPPSRAPRLGGSSLGYAVRLDHVQESPQVGGSYVGVWSTDGKSTVAAFRMSTDGRAGPPQVLLESEAPIPGVGYFPGMDTPSGQLGIVQQVSEDTARLLNYQWWHRGL
jgi:hypothetical protein